MSSHHFVVNQKVEVLETSRSPGLRGKKCKVVSLTWTGSSPAYRVRDLKSGETRQIVQKNLAALTPQQPPPVTPVLGLPTDYDYRLSGGDICYVSRKARCLPGRFVRILKGNGGPYKNNPQYTVEDLETGEIGHPTAKMLTYVHHVFTTAQVSQLQTSRPLAVASVIQAAPHGSSNLPMAVATQHVMIALPLFRPSRTRK